MRRHIIAILAFFTLPSVALSAPDEATIFFGNGVRTARKDAEAEKKALEKTVRADSRFSSIGLSFDLAYNQTDCIPGDTPGPDLGCIGDFYEAFRQLYSSEPPASFWLLMGGETVPGISTDEFFRIGGETTNPLPPPPSYVLDLTEQLSRYRAHIAANRKVVLVAHSQGNLFGNQAYGSLSASEKSSFGMVSVATPTDNVLGNYDEETAPYATLGEDPIRRWYVPFPTLRWNITNGGSVDNPEWRFHEFVGSYLGGTASKTKILDELLRVLESLEGLPPGFTRISDLTSPRAFHCAVRLEDGRVLVAGGFGLNRTALNTAELYDPATHTFSPTGAMLTGRGRPGCALLDDGRVLVAGGEVFRFVYTSSAEVYDPETNAFTAVGNMTTPRGEGWHAFTSPGGALLFAGTFEGNFGTGTAAVDRFDIGSNTFSRVGTLLGARRDYTAQVLEDDSVLLVGGVLNFALPVSPLVERYNTSTNQPQHTGQPSGQPRNRSWASALLPGGNVLVVAGTGLPAEVYSPGTGSFSILSESPAFHSGDFGVAAELPDGRVLILGYGRTVGDSGRIAEMFEPGTGTFTALGSLAVQSSCPGFVATPLLDGTILITGGGFPPSCDGAPLAEIFVP